MNPVNLKFGRLAAALLSALLLAMPWWGLSGLWLGGALVPLLAVSRSLGGSRRDFWRMAGWAALAFAGWNALIVWALWYATPVGPFAATLASTFLNLVAFMLYHYVSKRARKALAYTTLAAAWIATEYWYTVGSFSFPWLLLGNGFMNDAWAVQWYEYTGLFGGTLWMLVCNMVLFEALCHRREAYRWVRFAAVALLPAAVSLWIYLRWEEPAERMTVSVVQPDAGEKFSSGQAAQLRNLAALVAEAPADAALIAAPETALQRLDEARLESEPAVRELERTLAETHPDALLVVGAAGYRLYPSKMTETASLRNGIWQDHFNSALALRADGVRGIYHKGRLVIGAEATPMPWLFDLLDFLVIDLGGVMGQLGVGAEREVFTTASGAKVGPAICYESVYGDFYGDFVRRGAQAMLVITNDMWWRDTGIHRHHFAYARLRAIEHRRAVARSANTGISGFIDARGDVRKRLEWGARGVLTDEVALSDEVTFYTRYGDYIGRMAQYVLLLSLLYFAAYRIRKRNYLVD